MASQSPLTKSGSRETLWAILGSLLIAVVLASVFAGNPLTSVSRAYQDYSREPKAVGPAASTTTPPATAPATVAPK